MARSHLVRVGAMGVVGRFDAADAGRFARHERDRGAHARGLEIGEVLAEPEEFGSTVGGDGTILRGMTVEDRLLESRLAKNSHAAYAACQQRLNELSLSACLMDVEHLFDGRTLVFYFLGDVPPQVEQLKDELAEVYEGQDSSAHSPTRSRKVAGPIAAPSRPRGMAAEAARPVARSPAPARRGSTSNVLLIRIAG